MNKEVYLIEYLYRNEDFESHIGHLKLAFTSEEQANAYIEKFNKVKEKLCKFYNDKLTTYCIEEFEDWDEKKSKDWITIEKRANYWYGYQKIFSLKINLR